jgi:type IV secretory pathway VirB10-like protein
MTQKTPLIRGGAVIAASLAMTLAACGGSPKPAGEDAASAEAAAIAAERAELDKRAEELAAREAALATQQADAAAAAKAEADKAAAEAAAAKEAADKLAAEKAKAARLAAAKREAEFKAAQSRPAPEPAPEPAPKPVVVASGTVLPIAFTSGISTKTAKVGDPVSARLTSDLVVDGRQVAPAGAAVTGVVSDVYSGSREIGGTPRLGLRFERLSLGDGRSVAIAGDIVQQGKSESGKDAAKIAGGAVLGAVLGKQVDDGKGAVIGGLLGGAAGAAIAKNTGGDLEIADGTAASLVLTRSFEVK